MNINEINEDQQQQKKKKEEEESSTYSSQDQNPINQRTTGV